MEAEVNAAVKNVAHAAHASIAAKAQAELGSRAKDFLKGLKFTDLGDNSYLISLDGKYATGLEDGYSAYDMRAAMLASKKNVTVGSRAGQPWVQNSVPRGKSKETHKYAHVPMQQRPNSKAAGTSNMADAIKAMTAKNAQGLEQNLTKIFKNLDGGAIEGKVASIDGLVKYQKVYKSPTGKETVQSIYIKYRTVSERGKPWIHPGFEGIKAFDEAEADVAKQLNEIVNKLLK